MNENEVYLLGWVIGNANIYDDKIFFFIKNCNKDIVSKLYKIFINTLNVSINDLHYNINKNSDFYLKVTCNSFIRTIIHLLGLSTKDNVKKSYYKTDLKYPDISKDVLPFFVRGIFDSSGYIFKNKNNDICCGIRMYSKYFLLKLLNQMSISTNVTYNKKYNNYYFTLTNMNALDFLQIIYSENLSNNLDPYSISSELILNRKYDMYKNLRDSYNGSLYFKYYKTDKYAVSPFKMYYSDTGYNLTLVKKLKSIDGIEFYDTCIRIEPMLGYYFDLISKQLLLQTGYMLTESVNIIDSSYRENIVVSLVKVDKCKPDLILPCSLIQIIPRNSLHMTPIQMNIHLTTSLKSTNAFN